MKPVLLALASMSLLAAQQAPPDPGSSAACWAALGSRLAPAQRAALVALAPISNKKAPMEILVRLPAAPAKAAEGAQGADPQPVSNEAPDQVLEPKALFYGAPLEVYSKAQAKALGEGMVTPAGGTLSFHRYSPVTFLSRNGLELLANAGYLGLADRRGTKWYVRFKLLGPEKAWDGPAECSEDGLKLRSFILAGDWAKALDASLRRTVRRSSPNEPMLLALDILDILDRPQGKEAKLQEAAARLAALMPRSTEALTFSAVAYLASGRPELAGHLRGWMGELKPPAP